MSKLRFFCLLLALNTCSALSFAQDFEPGKGRAIIYFEAGTKVIVRLDSSLLQQKKEPISLKTGTYIIRAWAPTRMLFVDTITVKENRTSICVNRLKPTDEYVVYRKELRNYKLKKAAAFVPFPVGAFFSGYVLLTIKKNKKLMGRYEEDAATAAANYDASVSLGRINISKQQYEFSRSQYNKYLHKNNRLRTTACIAAPVGLAASAVLFVLTKKLVKPVYTETPLLTLNTIGIRNDYNSAYSLAIVLNINR